jgi:hypothetical protein
MGVSDLNIRSDVPRVRYCCCRQFVPSRETEDEDWKPIIDRGIYGLFRHQLSGAVVGTSERLMARDSQDWSSFCAERSTISVQAALKIL